MEIQIISQSIGFEELEEIAQKNYGEMVKGVVDIGRRVIALGGELHADAESVLLEKGSKQENLWGFNIYPKKSADQRIEYTSFINIRPRDKNFAIEIQDENLRSKIKDIIEGLICDDK